MRRTKRLRGQWRRPVLECRHEWQDTDDSWRPHLGTCGDGVVCLECGMLLTWDELARYMRGDD